MFFVKSLILGFAVSAPVGPIGLLCIQRVLAKGKTAGFATGLGAAAANIIYASLAAVGFTVITSFLLKYQLVLNILGAVFLIYLGIKTFLKKPPKYAASSRGAGLLGMFLSTLLLMLSNPVTILNFAGMFAGLGFSQESNSGFAAVTLLGGVFLGASLWWAFLSLAVNLFKTKITPHLGAVNKIAGVLIILLAVVSFIN